MRQPSDVAAAGYRLLPLLSVMLLVEVPPGNAATSSSSSSSVGPGSVWTGNAVESYYRDSFCSGTVLATDTETRVEILADGAFCRSITGSGWGSDANWTATTRTVVNCTSPDGSGRSGIFRSIFFCSEDDCSNCSSTASYVTRYSWADWADRVEHDSCHGADVLASDAAAADVLDWDSAFRDYYQWVAGDDKDAYMDFLVNGSCIKDTPEWTGNVTTAGYTTEGCGAGSEEEATVTTDTSVKLLEPGVFCIATKFGDSLSFSKAVVDCAAPDGSPSDPGVYFTSFNCADDACQDCDDDQTPAWQMRYSWATWNDATRGDVCHSADIVSEDADIVAGAFPDWDTAASTFYFVTSGELELYFDFFTDNSCIYANNPVATWDGAVAERVWMTAGCGADSTWRQNTTRLQLFNDGSFCQQASLAQPGGGGDPIRFFYSRFTVSCVTDESSAGPEAQGVYLHGTNCSSAGDCSVDDDRGYFSVYYTWDDFLLAAAGGPDACHSINTTVGGIGFQSWYQLDGDVDEYFDFLVNNSCVASYVDSLTWTGSATDEVYRDAYCASGVMFKEEDTRMQVLPGGDFCVTSEMSGWGASWTSYARSTIVCEAPDGSGESAAFFLSRNCSTPDCSKCADDVQFASRTTWANWMKRRTQQFDDCHGIDFLMGEDARAQYALDWESGFRDYYRWTGPDADSHSAFIEAHSCMADSMRWNGQVTTTGYLSDTCAAGTADPAGEGTDVAVALLEPGTFCTSSVFGDEMVFTKLVTECSSPSSVSGGGPGLYMSTYICWDSECSNCTDSGQPAWIARYSWDDWTSAMDGDQCHGVDVVAEDVLLLEGLFPDWDTNVSQYFYKTRSPNSKDLSSYFTFFNDNSCAAANRPVASWTGSLVTTNYASDTCAEDVRLVEQRTSLQLLADGSFCHDLQEEGSWASLNPNSTAFKRFTVSCVPETPEPSSQMRPYYYYYSYVAAVFGRDEPGVWLTGSNCSSPHDCSAADERGFYRFHFTWRDWYLATESEACHAVLGVDPVTGRSFQDHYVLTGDVDSYFSFLEHHSCVSDFPYTETTSDSPPPASTLSVGATVGIVVASVVVAIVVLAVAVVMVKKRTSRDTYSANPTTAVTHTQDDSSA